MMNDSLLSHTLASLSYTKLLKEASGADPDLRRFVAFANTLDVLTEWIHDDMKCNARKSLHTANTVRNGLLEIGGYVEIGGPLETLNNADQEAQCEEIEWLSDEEDTEAVGIDEGQISAEKLQDLESRIRDKIQIGETMHELAMIKPLFQKEFKVHIGERELDSGEEIEDDDGDDDTEGDDYDNVENQIGEDGEESSDDDSDSDASSDCSINDPWKSTLSASIEKSNIDAGWISNKSSNCIPYPLSKLQSFSTKLSTILESSGHAAPTLLSSESGYEDPAPKGKTTFGPFYCGTEMRLEGAHCIDNMAINSYH
jgi:hypothetical protein